MYNLQLQKTRVLRKQPQHQATFMQPFQCYLQPEIQEPQRTTHTDTTTRCKTHRRNRSRQKRPQPHPPHTRGTFHRRLQPLYTEKHKVSCSGFLPTTHALQHSCSYSNAICNHSFKQSIELRTQEQPLLQNTQKEPIRDRGDPSRTRRKHEVPFIAGCSHFTRKNARFRALASSSKHSPCNIHAAIAMRFAASRSYYNPHLSTHIATEHDNNHAAIPMLFATRDSRTAKNYAHRHNHSLQNTQKEPIATETTPAAPAAHTRYLSSPAATTLHGKTQGFVLRLPPQNIAHATFMQAFQCDLHPQIQETQRTTHTDTTTRCKTHRRNRSRQKRPQPHPPHARGTFHRRLQPLYTEKHKVSCSGFLLKTQPMQHSCRHSNAICIHKFKKRIELRTQLQELRHHLPSSPLPFLTTSLRHHFPSSPLPMVPTSLPHHAPSSPLPFVTTSLPHHFPSSPPPIVTTSLRHQPVSYLLNLCDVPPFIKVSPFVRYCYVM